MSDGAFLFNLGDRVKDKISKLEGIIVSRAEHLNGCARYWIQPEGHKDGKPLEGTWVDEGSVIVIKPIAVKPTQYRIVEEQKRGERKTGGPSSQPASHSSGQSRR